MFTPDDPTSLTGEQLDLLWLLFSGEPTDVIFFDDLVALVNCGLAKITVPMGTGERAKAEITEQGRLYTQSLLKLTEVEKRNPLEGLWREI